MRVESVGNGSYVVRHWRLPSVKQLRTAGDVDALPDDPVALKMLLVEAVIRSEGAHPLLVYGDRWLRSAADVHVLPDDPVPLKMLLTEAVIRENGAEALLAYGDKLLQNAADVHALPDDPALLKMLLMEAVYRSRRMTNYALGQLEPGRHYVGNGTGLFVHVSQKGRVSFGQRLRVAGSGRRVEMGLGSWPAVRLEEAKAIAAKNHRMARHGQNPVLARGEIPTVAEAVEEFFKEFGPSWVGRNTEHAYRASLAKHVLPALGDQRIDLVRRSDLAAVVKPAWLEYRRVGRDLLRVLRGAFRWARAHDFRSDLPTDGLEDLLPRIEREERHHAALSHADIAEAVAKARAFENHVRRVTPRDEVLALAFEMTILTGLRRQELIGIRWSDIDEHERILTIDALRMKKKTRAHKVPLSSAAWMCFGGYANWASVRPAKMGMCSCTGARTANVSERIRYRRTRSPGSCSALGWMERCTVSAVRSTTGRPRRGQMRRSWSARWDTLLRARCGARTRERISSSVDAASWKRGGSTLPAIAAQAARPPDHAGLVVADTRWCCGSPPISPPVRPCGRGFGN